MPTVKVAVDPYSTGDGLTIGSDTLVGGGTADGTVLDDTVVPPPPHNTHGTATAYASSTPQVIVAMEKMMKYVSIIASIKLCPVNVFCRISILASCLLSNVTDHL